MPRINKPLESFAPQTLNPQLLSAWLRGLKLGGKASLTLSEIEDGLVALCEAVEPMRQAFPPNDAFSQREGIF